ncbi:unnamed protein product [Cunninghamella echinulata]
MHPGTVVLIVIGSVGFLWGSYEIGYRVLDWVSYRRDQKKYEEYLRQYYEKNQLQRNDIISSPQSEQYDEKKDDRNPFTDNDSDQDSDDDDDNVPLAYHPSLNLRRRKAYGKESEDISINYDEKEKHLLQQRGNSIMGIFKDNEQVDNFNDNTDQAMFLLKRPKKEPLSMESQESQESVSSIAVINESIEKNDTPFQEVQESSSSMIINDESIEKNDVLSPVLTDNTIFDNNNNNIDDEEDTLVFITQDNINNNNDNSNVITQQQLQLIEDSNDQSVYQSVYLTPQQGSESDISPNSLSQDSWTSLQPSYSSDNISSTNHRHQQSNNSLAVNEDIVSLSSSSSFSVVSLSDDERQPSI